MKTKTIILIIAIALFAGYLLGTRRESRIEPADVATTEAVATEYTCSMHPQIRQPAPGLCPLCAMDLIPVDRGGAADPGPQAISLSPAARERARIETAPVERGAALTELAFAGTLAYDSSRTRNAALLTDGQVRQLWANVIGQRMAAGAPLADVYSPDVFAAGRELLAAGNNELLVSSARQKLRLLGLGEEDIEHIIQSTQVPETHAVRSPINGVVVSISAWPGNWLMRGEELMALQDTSVMWAQLDVYEKDLAMLAVGLPVRLSVDAYPGEEFTGTVTFVSAEADPMTRSVKARVDVPNPDGRLKPGLFVRARASVKWTDDALSVPATAVLSTGKRAVVYVQAPDDPAVFEGRIVTPGPRIGDRQVIVSGLREGELVASRGAMRIDSSLQILAKPSLMSFPSDGSVRPQTNCPVEGGKVDRDVFVNYQGYRIYFCCPGCDSEFLEDPEKYLAEMRAQGIEPERAPAQEGGHEHH